MSACYYTDLGAVKLEMEKQIEAARFDSEQPKVLLENTSKGID